MLANRTQALAYILEDEGPELNVGPGEPGGASRLGVSVTALSDWNKRHGKNPATIGDVSLMTPALAGEIYGSDYLDVMRFNEMPAGVDYRLADIAVNLGVTGGSTALQLALGMWPVTGIIDAATMAAVTAADAKALAQSLSAAWIAKKHESPSWSKYGHGWSARNQRATQRALAMIGG